MAGPLPSKCGESPESWAVCVLLIGSHRPRRTRDRQSRQSSFQGIHLKKSPRKTSQPRLVRDVMAADPYLRSFVSRLNDPDFPTPDEVAQARHVLAHSNANRQADLPLPKAV